MVFLRTPANEQAPMFSPDDRWIAYFLNSGGDSDIFVRPFPGPGGPWRVSTAGGRFPRWSSTSRELLFQGLQNPYRLMVAPYVADGQSFRAETPQIWSPTNVLALGGLSHAYDLHPDGKRVAAASAPEQGGAVQDKIVVVFNFGDYLRKIAPGTK